ncbi:MAG: hypothetical protein PHQ52_01455 [Candidatus Omnitrophica bacterium]|nr:hypothetical protein [Candidatus Omnitrophota bacterium]
MKKYTKPKIISVELNSGQAILAVCRLGGVYLGNTTNKIYCGTMSTTLTNAPCNVTPKGGPGSGYMVDDVPDHMDQDNAVPS